MSSSTSSSKSGAPRDSRREPRRDWWCVVVALALLFVAFEAFCHVYAHRRERDLSDPTNITSGAVRAARLADAEGLRVALVGNSTTQEGVDLRTFQQELQAAGATPARVDLFAPSASNIRDWHFLMNRYFWQPRHNPDLFVVTFYGDNLCDVPTPDIGRLAQFFTTPSDWPEVLGQHLTQFADRCEYVASAASSMYAMRAVVRDKILHACVPHYAEFALRVNSTALADQNGQTVKAAQDAPTVAPRHGTYRTLEAFLRAARRNGAKICFVAFPRRDLAKQKAAHYDIDPEALRLIREAGMELIDLRAMPRLTNAMYRDEVHLNERGRPLFSRRLAWAVSPLLSKPRTVKRSSSALNP